MKRNLGFLIIAFVVIILLFAIFSDKDKKNDFVLEAPVSFCFLRDVDSYEGKDLAYIRADLGVDGSASGILNMAYLDEYRISGEFLGFFESDGTEYVLDVLHAYTERGELKQEERIIKFNSELATIGHGDLVETEGYFLYKDKENLTFYDQLLPSPCEDIPPYIK